MKAPAPVATQSSHASLRRSIIVCPTQRVFCLVDSAFLPFSGRRGNATCYPPPSSDTDSTIGVILPLPISSLPPLLPFFMPCILSLYSSPIPLPSFPTFRVPVPSLLLFLNPCIQFLHSSPISLPYLPIPIEPVSPSTSLVPPHHLFS